MTLPTTSLGATGLRATRLGLGGEGVLRTHGRKAAAHALIDRAVTLGVSYFDSAHAYAGSEEYYGHYWSQHPDARARVFITSKSASRDARAARRDLDTTLARMQVFHVDLWQIHDVREESDLRAVTAKGGALEAFLAAKKDGLAKRLGVTGHHDPAVLLKAVRELPVDAVLLPCNVAEAALGGFLTEVAPEARARGMAVIGMKSLGQGALLEGAPPGVNADTLLRFALAQPVDVVIVGCSTPAEVEANAATAAAPAMGADEQRALVASYRAAARKYAYYRGV